MKLLVKSGRYFIGSALVVFLVGGIVFYFAFERIIEHEVSELLLHESDQWIQQLEMAEEPILPPKSNELEIELTASYSPALVYTDTLFYNSLEEETMPFKQLTRYAIINGQNYKLTVRKSLIEKEDILFMVTLSLSVLFVFILLGLFWVNRFVSKKLWSSFYQNLKLFQGYDLNQSKQFKPIESDIEEFNALNETLMKVTDKIAADYISLKEFTENAAHETQNPIAIIKSNLDILAEDETIKVDGQQRLEKMSSALQRVSLINKNLLLLSKLENHQFSGMERMDMKAVINSVLEDFKDFSDAMAVKVEILVSEASCYYIINKSIVDILLQNLIGNAIKHNIQNGFLRIELIGDILTITNSGLPLTVPAESLFERFKKGKSTSNSIGLGLAIVKTACDNQGLQIQYQSKNDEHQITVDFSALEKG
ncbi:sensor histidine kinase [Roseivirga echinicomitans]|uniref:histidine kinase n=1 Tax=Roseivirga echinicomitans TaxID=296218 RepID=A0A150XPU9_9BACT|nr:HAMP domain-containing sensor histidine kinase [Roseivirga echinicomitans]KYG80787.1 hypothetical protein AWN68_16920 [Roseivirga echinicomitans]